MHKRYKNLLPLTSWASIHYACQSIIFFIQFHNTTLQCNIVSHMSHWLMLSMWGKIMIPMYRLWLRSLYGLYGPRCLLSPKRLLNLITHSLSLAEHMHKMIPISLAVDKLSFNSLWVSINNPLYPLHKWIYKRHKLVHSGLDLTLDTTWWSVPVAGAS